MERILFFWSSIFYNDNGAERSAVAGDNRSCHFSSSWLKNLKLYFDRNYLSKCVAFCDIFKKWWNWYHHVSIFTWLFWAKEGEQTWGWFGAPPPHPWWVTRVAQSWLGRRTMWKLLVMDPNRDCITQSYSACSNCWNFGDTWCNSGLFSISN